jgi:hypothetical protein
VIHDFTFKSIESAAPLKAVFFKESTLNYTFKSVTFAAAFYCY